MMMGRPTPKPTAMIPHLLREAAADGRSGNVPPE
jgi:hypothetical protein